MIDKKRLQAQMVLAGMNVKEVSTALGINETTFYRKMNNDGDMN